MKKGQRNIKKEFAKTLFISGQMSQDEISKMVEVSRVTIGKWVKAGEWEEMRRSTTLTPANITTQLNKQLDEININIASRERGKRFATPAESDAILKISKTIKNLNKEIGLDVIISVSMQFLQYLRQVGETKMGKEFLKYFDMFIKDKAK